MTAPNVATDPHAWWDNQIELHPPKDDDVARRMDAVRNRFQMLGHVLVEQLPPGPDLTIALRALKEASMHAIGAIACNQEDLS